MQLTKIVEYDMKRNDLLDHRAIVVAEDYTPADKIALVEATSIAVGYHPLGYGIYGNTTVVSNGKPNEYRVYWRTGTHCD